MTEEAEYLSEEEEITDLSNSDVVTKYKAAAAIANKTISGLLSFCKPGVKIVTACAFGDTLITKQCENIFKSKNIEKGIAFPTCVSVNEVVCHFSPFQTEAKELVLVKGDVVKLDLGVFIDGYIVVAAKTFICSDNNLKPEALKGKQADCMVAAYTALEGCTKLMKEGASNQDISEFIAKVSECYGVNPIQGVLMHQLKRFVIDGNEVIVNKIDPEHKVDTFTFEKNNVYTLDIFLSTGSGKPIEKDIRTTVYKRALDQNYNLKMAASRQLFHKMQDCGTLPFTLRGLTKEEKTARLGIIECMKHSLVHPYPVLIEKALTDGEKPFVVHLKATVFVTSSGTTRVTSVEGLESLKEWCVSDKENTEEIKEILSRSAKNKKKKKKTKKPAAEQN